MALLLVNTAPAQLSYLKGSVNGRGELGSAGQNNLFSHSQTFDGVFSLSGRAYVYDPALADVTFKFNLVQGIAKAGDATTSSKSWNRDVNWYQVDGAFFSNQFATFTLGSSLSSIDLTGSNTADAGVVSTGAYSARVLHNNASARMELGGGDFVSAVGEQSTTQYRGVLQDTAIRQRSYNVQYATRGDSGQGTSLVIARSESDGGAGTPVFWENAAVFSYGGNAGADGLTSLAQYRSNILGSELRANLYRMSSPNAAWRRTQFVDANLYTTGNYARGNLSYQQRYSYADKAFSASVGGTVGYSATYAGLGPDQGSMLAGMTGGASGSAGYLMFLDTGKTVRSQSTLLASSLVSGAKAPLSSMVGGGEAIQWQISRGTSLSGSVTASRVIDRLGATSLGEQLSASTPIGGASFSASISHDNRFAPSQDSLGYHVAIYEDMNSWLRLSGVLPGTRIFCESYLQQRMSAWHVVDMSVQLSLRTILIDELLSVHGSYTYGQGMQSLAKTQRLNAGATLMWRAVMMTAEYSMVESSGSLWSDLLVTFARPFSIY